MRRTAATAPLRPLDIGIGVGTSLWYALPDVIERRWVRGLVKTAVVVTAAGVVIARADDDASASDSLVAGLQPAGLVGAEPVSASSLLDGARTASAEDVPPARAAAVAAAAGVASLVGTLAGDRAMARTAIWLRARGIDRPYSVMGAGIGVATALARPSRTLGS